MASSTVNINIRPYLNTHGHEPRGTGSWWFQVLDNIFCYQTSYSRAVAAVKREVRQRQQQKNLGYAPSITLLP